MKLKLEAQDNIAILMITEGIDSGHDAILKAGITKILMSGKKTIILDLTNATRIHPEAMKGLSGLEKYVKERAGRLLLVSPLPDLGHVQSLQNALELAKGDLSALRASEAAIQTRLKKLENQKKELEIRSQGIKPTGVNLKTLKGENTQLKKQILQLETLIKKLLEKRNDFTPLPSVTTKMDTIQKTIVMVLEQEGILPVR